MYNQLRELYIEQKLPLSAVGELLGVSQTTVYRRLKKYGLRVRGSGELNIGKPSGATGKTWRLSEEAKENHRQALLGKRKSDSHRRNMSLSRMGKRRGEDNPNWRGGSSKLDRSRTKRVEYKIWRTRVFERDNYSCVFCGVKSGNGGHIMLNADHIRPWSKYPALRFDINNGRTLCIDCHKKTPTYGAKARLEVLGKV